MEKSRGKAKIAYDQKDGSQGAEWISYDAGRLRELNKGGGGASSDNKRKSEGGGPAAGGGSAKKGKLVLPSCPKVTLLPVLLLTFPLPSKKMFPRPESVKVSKSEPVLERRRKHSTRAATSPKSLSLFPRSDVLLHAHLLTRHRYPRREVWGGNRRSLLGPPPRLLPASKQQLPVEVVT